MSEMVEAVWRKHRSCTACDLSQTRRKVVFGTGNPEAKILLVVDPPTMTQDRAGTHATSDIRWLVKMYKKVRKLRTRLETCADKMLSEVFIISATMCVPIHQEGDLEGQGRKATDREIKSCRPRTLDTIYAVDPYVIVAAGPAARRAVFGGKTGIDTSGTVLEYVEIPGQCGVDALRYSVLSCHSLEIAEIAGDYHYEHGKVASVQKALTQAFSLVDTLQKEDTL